jgi:hypothetical protein
VSVENSSFRHPDSRYVILRGFFVICCVQPDFSGFRIADGYVLGV